MNKSSFEEKIKEYKKLYLHWQAGGTSQQMKKGDEELIKSIFSYYPFESFELEFRTGFPGPLMLLTKINDEEIMKNVGIIDFWNASSLIDRPELKSFLVEFNISKEVFLDFCETLFVRIEDETLFRIKGVHKRR